MNDVLAGKACHIGTGSADILPLDDGGSPSFLGHRPGHQFAGCPAAQHEDVVFYGRALVELVEAGVRGGRPDEAVAALGRLSERTRASGTEWALGIEARCRGLLSDDEALYRESVERLARSRAALELGRSRLLYGE